MRQVFRKGTISLMAVTLILSNIGLAYTDDVADLKQLVNTLLNRVNELEKRIAQYESKENRNQMKVNKVEQRIDDVARDLNVVKVAPSSNVIEAFNGIDIGLGLTSTYKFTHNANGDSLSQNGEDAGDASWSLDLKLSKTFDDDGSAYMLLEAGQGAGVDDELKIFSPVNFDATGGSGTVEMVEGWYERYIGNSTMTFGKLDGTIYIDTNEYANDEGGQFMGNMFRNNPTVQFPGNGAGLRWAHALNDNLEFETLVMDGNGDWEDIFDGPFAAAQVNIKPGLFDRDGNYRFYGWNNSQGHTKLSDSGSTENTHYGFGVSFDQEISDLVGVFARFGYQNPDMYLTGADSINLEQAYSLGMRIATEHWGRDEDAFGLAFGQVIPSDDYKNANSGFKAVPESHIEAYYSYVVNESLTLSPIVHVIIDPYGGDAAREDKTIIVVGIRSQVDF